MRFRQGILESKSKTGSRNALCCVVFVTADSAAKFVSAISLTAAVLRDMIGPIMNKTICSAVSHNVRRTFLTFISGRQVPFNDRAKAA
jgi:hypothetical protein